MMMMFRMIGTLNLVHWCISKVGEHTQWAVIIRVKGSVVNHTVVVPLEPKAMLTTLIWSSVQIKTLGASSELPTTDHPTLNPRKASRPQLFPTPFPSNRIPYGLWIRLYMGACRYLIWFWKWISIPLFFSVYWYRKRKGHKSPFLGESWTQFRWTITPCWALGDIWKLLWSSHG